MATDQLREALEQAQKRAGKLSPDRQDNIAREILQKIEAAEWDEKWDETLASPEISCISRACPCKTRRGYCYWKREKLLDG